MQTHLRRFILLFLFTLLIVPGQAQKKGYSPGYIITNEGETIEGWVKDRSSGTFMELYSRIRFQAANSRITRRYGPDEILGYGLDDQHFESVPLSEVFDFFRFTYYIHEDNDRVFLKIISGTEELTYYHWEYVDDNSNYLDYIPLFHRYGSNEMVRVTQGMLGLKRNKLKKYFSDCPDLVNAIDQKQVKEIHEVFDFYIEHCTGEFE